VLVTNCLGIYVLVDVLLHWDLVWKVPFSVQMACPGNWTGA
jgi:hypothetical protein